MLKAIKAIIRCTATNDAVPVLTHVAISDGFAHAFNGRMYARAVIEHNPFEIGIEEGICVRADMLLAALSALGDTKAKAEIDMDHGTLRFTSKRYRARVPVLSIDNFFLQELPSSRKAAKIDFDLTTMLETLRPIIGDNPALPWAQGYCVEVDHIAATNSSVMAKIDARCGIAPTILTAEFVNELISQDVQIDRLLSANGRVTAWLENGVILSSVIIDGMWPKSFDAVVGPTAKSAKFTEIPDTFIESLQSIAPFSEDSKAANVTIAGDKLELVSSETASASVTVEDLNAPAQCAFNVNQLRAVTELAREWDLAKFPIVPFRDKARGIVGAIAGVKV